MLIYYLFYVGLTVIYRYVLDDSGKKYISDLFCPKNITNNFFLNEIGILKRSSSIFPKALPP